MAAPLPQNVQEEYTSNNLPAAFWDQYPTNTEDNTDLAAINAILEESTPDKRAETYKDQGNDALKRGLQLKKKFYLREALNLYTKALEMGSTLPGLLSVLHSNRAHAHLLLENYRRALEDSLAATGLQATNLKGYYRGARAATKLGQLQQAVDICEAGLAVDPGAKELQQMRAEAERQLRAAADARQREATRALAERAPARRLAAALVQRGYKVGLPQMSVGEGKPYIDDAGAVHWPMVFLYPETMQMDAVKDAAEGDTLAGHLDSMFGPKAPPLQWDSEGAYTRERVQLFYLAHAAQPLSLEALTEALHSGWPKDAVQEAGPSRYGPQAARWVPIQEHAALHEVLRSPDYVIPGVPVFFVVAAATAFRERFLADETPLL